MVRTSVDGRHSARFVNVIGAFRALFVAVKPGEKGDAVAAKGVVFLNEFACELHDHRVNVSHLPVNDELTCRQGIAVVVVFHEQQGGLEGAGAGNDALIAYHHIRHPVLRGQPGDNQLQLIGLMFFRGELLLHGVVLVKPDPGRSAQ